MKEELGDDFLFSGMSANDQTMSVFDQKQTTMDGIYRPKLDDAKDKKIGYRATMRFLPNLMKNGKIGPSAIEKHVHYVDFKNSPDIAGYYDCRKNYEPTCELCAEYWKLKNSKNQADVEKAALINRTTKYYSYVMIIEDDQHQELVGKILLFPYGYTIKEKINAERTGEVSGDPNNIFDIAKGKDFKLIIKEKGGFQNYDASQFMESSPIKLFDEKTSTFKMAPVDADGKITNPKAQAKIKEVLMNREVDIDDHKPVQWDEEMKVRVAKVINILYGNDVFVAEQKTNQAKTGNVEKPVDSESSGGAVDADDFFSLDSDD